MYIYKNIHLHLYGKPICIYIYILSIQLYVCVAMCRIPLLAHIHINMDIHVDVRFVCSLFSYPEHCIPEGEDKEEKKGNAVSFEHKLQQSVRGRLQRISYTNFAPILPSGNQQNTR